MGLSTEARYLSCCLYRGSNLSSACFEIKVPVYTHAISLNCQNIDDMDIDSRCRLPGFVSASGGHKLTATCL
jgi:hypothetical protein